MMDVFRFAALRRDVGRKVDFLFAEAALAPDALDALRQAIAAPRGPRTTELRRSLRCISL